MNITLSGYGRMGRMIRGHAEERGHRIGAVVDPQAEDATHAKLAGDACKGADAVIDFSVPEAALESIRAACDARVPIVVGTTGWYERMDEAREMVNEAGIGLIWSGNFSLGVNIFFTLVKAAAQVFNRFTDYDPFVHEFHHNRKADSPSGTAEMIGRMLLERIDRKSSLVTEALHRRIGEEELHISSTRSGSIPGTHLVAFDSPVDTVELKHTARTREGFAAGAVAAAEWIADKHGFFAVEDMMNTITGGE
jgi:4-hydroxy-tetrahydrodipicolinate reductase